MKTILAIDPGRDKCGLAVVTTGRVLHQQVISRVDTAKAVVALVSTHHPDELILGNGTGSGALADELHAIAGISLRIVEESYTSQRARTRFLAENPPKGIRRLIPRGLLTPDRPYDDYVAVILAEDYLEQNP